MRATYYDLKSHTELWSSPVVFTVLTKSTLDAFIRDVWAFSEVTRLTDQAWLVERNEMPFDWFVVQHLKAA